MILWYGLGVPQIHLDVISKHLLASDSNVYKACDCWDALRSRWCILQWLVYGTECVCVCVSHEADESRVWLTLL